MALKANEWTAQIAEGVGRRVEHFRTNGPAGTGPKLTAQAIADRCTELGVSMDRAVIAKLEKGLRQTITVGELMVLAKALNVPPVLLLFPLGGAEAVEVLPGQQMETWGALKWFTGHGNPADDDRESTVPTQLWGAHEMAVTSWQEAEEDMVGSRSRGLSVEEAQRLADTTRRFQVRNLRAVRGRIRALGLTPPALPAGLEHIDSDGAER